MRFTVFYFAAVFVDSDPNIFGLIGSGCDLFDEKIRTYKLAFLYFKVVRFFFENIQKGKNYEVWLHLFYLCAFIYLA
jgi:hypothetical protein